MSRPTHQPIALEVPEVDGKRVTVMGLGQFGGGVGVTKYLVARGARVTLTALRNSRSRCRNLPTRSNLGA